MTRMVVCGVLAVATLMAPAAGGAQSNPAPAQHEGAFAPVAQGEQIENLDALKREVRRYHDCTCTCGCYAKDLDTQADRAIAYLQRRTAHRGSREKLALVLDIDETTLSNWEEMSTAGFAYDKKGFDTWVDSAAAPAIPATLRLYREAERLEVHVFFLTGRSETQRAVTERNLRSRGFAAWDGLILRSPEEAALTAQAYKTAERVALVAKGYDIVLNVGDQWSDLRGKAQAEYSVKYPDPYYFIP
ncbi:MAG: HAD family acid phosphatase [Acidobacteriota bacterium]